MVSGRFSQQCDRHDDRDQYQQQHYRCAHRGVAAQIRTQLFVRGPGRNGQHAGDQQRTDERLEDQVDAANDQRRAAEAEDQIEPALHRRAFDAGKSGCRGRRHRFAGLAVRNRT